MNNIKVLIAGGGTGGHLFPAIAIGDTLKSLGVVVKYAGSKYGIEANILPKRNEQYLLLDIRGLQRSFSASAIAKNLLFPYRFIKSYFQSKRFIKSFNPDVVVGTGGYSSGLPLLVAHHLKKKTIIQEQNSFPGITTRKLAHNAKCICTAYEDASNFLNNDNVIITGNPVRRDMKVMEPIVARKSMEINENKPTMLIIGGSQGSRPLNNHFIKHFKLYANKGIQIIWQCGKLDYTTILSQVNHPNVFLYKFIHKMNIAYSSADVVISRAGALVLSEMTIMGKSMVLVPFPSAAGNHQYKNACSLTSKNAAELVEQHELQNGTLEKTIFNLFENTNKREMLSKNALKLAKTNATETITTKIMEVAQS